LQRKKDYAYSKQQKEKGVWGLASQSMCSKIIPNLLETPNIYPFAIKKSPAIEQDFILVFALFF